MTMTASQVTLLILLLVVLACLLDIIANNPMDQKVVDLSSSQHYSLVENAIYRSVFPPQGV